METLALGIVWVAILLVLAALREISKIALAIIGILVVCILIHIHIRGRKMSNLEMLEKEQEEWDRTAQAGYSDVEEYIRKCKNCGTEIYSVNSDFKCTKCGCVNGEESGLNDSTGSEKANRVLRKI